MTSESPSKISPNKTGGGSQKQMNESHTNNGQVMTQISAIYAKRSRSYLNQFNQTNNQANNINHASHQVRDQTRQPPNHHLHAAPQDHYQDHNKQGSPRLGRLRGISPQSREKNYISGPNNNTTGQPNTNGSHPGISSSAASHHSNQVHQNISINNQSTSQQTSISM